MRTVCTLLAAVLVMAFSGAAMAQSPGLSFPAGTTPEQAATITANFKSGYAPLGMGLSVIGIGIGLGLIGFGAMGGIARQPEQADNIRTAMLIVGGLVEGAGIIALVLCLVTQLL